MDAWIVDAVRSPRGKAGPAGGLHALRPVELLAQLFDALRDRAGLGPDELDDLVLEVPLLCELQVELVDPDLGDRVMVLDQEDRPLRLVESFGVFLSFDESAALEEGRTGMLRVPESGVTLVLLRGEEEVTSRPLTLDPEERTLVRL